MYPTAVLLRVRCRPRALCPSAAEWVIVWAGLGVMDIARIREVGELKALSGDSHIDVVLVYESVSRSGDIAASTRNERDGAAQLSAVVP